MERGREGEGEKEGGGAKVITTQHEFGFSRLKNYLSSRVGSENEASCLKSFVQVNEMKIKVSAASFL
jgi:hypothetical protein